MKTITSTILLTLPLVLIVLGLSITAAAQRQDSLIPIKAENCGNCGNAGAGSFPDLGTAANFAVLGGSTVTNTGPSMITGNLGVSPGTSVTGFPPGVVSVGSIHSNDTAAILAEADALAAWNSLSPPPCTNNLTGSDLGGLTVFPGINCFDSSAQLTGNLTLDALGDPSAVFIFRIGSTLTTATSSSVTLANGASACKVFFQVGSSATLGTSTAFRGNLMAFTSITLTTGTSILGRAIALNGAVTMDTNAIIECNLVVSAAPLTLGGRVTDANGRSIARTLITLTDSHGKVRTAITNPFGYYVLTDISAGQSVTVQASNPRYTFADPVIFVTLRDSVTDANFVAN